MKGKSLCKLCMNACLWFVVLFVAVSRANGQDCDEERGVIYVRKKESKLPVINKDTVKVADESNNEQNKIVTLPKIWRGDYALMDLHFRNNDIQRPNCDVVELIFDVTENGGVENVKIMRSTSKSFNKQVLLVLSNTYWYPAKNTAGKAVRHTMPKQWLYRPK